MSSTPSPSAAALPSSVRRSAPARVTRATRPSARPTPAPGRSTRPAATARHRTDRTDLADRADRAELDLRDLRALEAYLSRQRLFTHLRRPTGAPPELDVRDVVGHTATVWCGTYDRQRVFVVCAPSYERYPIGWISDPRAAARRVGRCLERDA